MAASRYINFPQAHSQLTDRFKRVARIVPPSIWQGVDVSGKPEMGTYELEDVFFSFPVGTEDLAYHRQSIKPSLPWADRHFELDRVSGEPLNPGKTWTEWPYAHKANEFRPIRTHKEPQFNHSYAERYWPKLAGLTDEGATKDCPEYIRENFSSRVGIRYDYGDLGDVINLLVRNPLTRNAYLPVWFPEDTGVVHGGRTPCSIGYLFRMRENRLSVFYDIRSCDYVRHFRDDVYLTVRLLLWVLDQCRKKDEQWNKVKPGMFSMHIGSFHIFKNDWATVFSEVP